MREGGEPHQPGNAATKKSLFVKDASLSGLGRALKRNDSGATSPAEEAAPVSTSSQEGAFVKDLSIVKLPGLPRATAKPQSDTSDVSPREQYQLASMTQSLLAATADGKHLTVHE